MIVFTLLAVTLLAYWPCLGAPYLWDDISLIEQNPTLNDHANLTRYFYRDLGQFNRDPRQMGFYRPLQALTFHLEIAAFGRNATLQRLINVLLHFSAAVALWLLALSMIRRPAAAFFAGLLYALHPLCTEQVCLIANRGGLLVGALSLWTMALIARAIPRQGNVRVKWLIAAGIAYAAALLGKPNALVLIAPVGAWLWLNRFEQRKSGVWPAVLGTIGGLAMLYIVWRWGILGISHAHKAAGEGDALTRLLAIPRLTLEALRLSILPVGLRAIRSIDYAGWASAPTVLVSSAIWLVLFCLAFKARRRAPAVTFAAVWFAATMAPSSGLIPLVRPVAEHYYYLPAAAVPLALAALFAWLPKRRTIRVAMSLVLALFAVATVARAGVWQSEGRLWTDNLRYEPTNSQVLNNLGAYYAERGDSGRALSLFDRAVKANPGNLKARLNRAHQALIMGLWPEVERDLRAVLTATPCHTKALVNLGMATVLHPSAEIETLLLSHTARHNCASVVEVGKGMAYSQQGDEDRAEKHFRRFLEIAPQHPLAAGVRAQLK